MENQNPDFEFTYSPQREAQVQKIRQKYLPPAEDKLEQLKQLDRSITQKAQAWALSLGITGALILGTGMSLAMTELGAALGPWGMFLGILIGLAGLIPVALAYPVYNRILTKTRQKYADVILELADQALHQS